MRRTVAGTLGADPCAEVPEPAVERLWNREVTMASGSWTSTLMMALALCVAGSARSAEGPTSWLDLVGSNVTGEEIAGVVATPDGGVMTVGTLELDGVEWLWLGKRDGQGGRERERVVDQPGLAGSAIVQAADGSFVVAANDPFTDGVVMRFGGPQGIHWSRRLSGPGGEWDELNGLAASADGGFLAVGMTDSYPASGYRTAWAVKLSADGEVEWARTLGSDLESPQSLEAVEQVADGGYVAVGKIRQDWPWIVMLDPDGAIEWQRMGGRGGTGGGIEDVVPIAGGIGYAAVGSVPSNELIGRYEVWAFAFDGAGDLLWQRALSIGSSLEDLRDARVARVPEGLLVLSRADVDHPDSKLAAIVLDERGELLGGKLYDLGLPGFAILGGVSGSAESGFFVGGGSWEYPVFTEAFLARLPADGAIDDCPACIPLPVHVRQPPELPVASSQPSELVETTATDFPFGLVEVTMESRRLCPEDGI